MAQRIGISLNSIYSVQLSSLSPLSSTRLKLRFHMNARMLVLVKSVNRLLAEPILRRFLGLPFPCGCAFDVAIISTCNSSHAKCSRDDWLHHHSNMFTRLETPGFNGYSITYSPFFADRLAVATSANYGIVGNGRLHLLRILPSGNQLRIEKMYVPCGFCRQCLILEKLRHARRFV
jgi:hypothetical protein